MDIYANEVWKDIKGYSKYQISSYGRVWSKKRQIYLKQYKNNSGYLTVSLSADNGKVKRELIHRLVAIAFLENPNNYPCVNHKDEDKENNHLTNLEWCDKKYNINYGTCRERIGNSNSKAIRVIETGIIYPSGKACAEALGTSADIVSKVLHNKSRCKTAKGFHLEFVNI